MRRLKISRESLIKPPTRPITNSNSLYYSDYDSATSSVPENTTLISNDQSNHLVSGAVSTTTLVPSALPTPLAVCDLSNMARKKKLFDDLAKVDQNVLVLNMMLAENAELANSVELSDDTKSLMQALASAITAMSDRLVSLIPRWEALVEQSGEHHNEELDEITMELLSHNDSCNTVLTRYNRFVRTLAAGTCPHIKFLFVITF
ncbi:unnamed protein product [Protopolystoma xenopodis]|uniref:Uncharacterized protein n=1 Tax=Protopolystoma xenopodis TaxID=117903 RepID=A0A3S5A8M9_9PLAT|nr:unnamed protein product [Protopolystoma xenopodis]